MIRYLILTTTLFLFASGSAAKDSDQYKASSITSQLMVLQGKSGNIVLLHGPDGVLLADNDYAEQGDALISRVDRLTRRRPLRYVINTDWHPHHTGSNPLLGRNALIVAHDNVRKRLSTQQTLPQTGRPVEPIDPSGWPDITYQREIHLYFNGTRIAIVNYPNGRTDGDSVVHFIEDNVLYAGDLYIREGFPLIDLRAGGNAVQLAHNVTALLGTIDSRTLVIPGRGELSNTTELARYAEMLESSIDSVRKLKILGMSLKQVQQHGLDAKWAAWGNGEVDEKNWIEAIYLSF